MLGFKLTSIRAGRKVSSTDDDTCSPNLMIFVLVLLTRSQSIRAIATCNGLGVSVFAGTDNRIRVWDFDKPENSYVLGMNILSCIFPRQLGTIE